MTVYHIQYIDDGVGSSLKEIRGFIVEPPNGTAGINRRLPDQLIGQTILKGLDINRVVVTVVREGRKLIEIQIDYYEAKYDKIIESESYNSNNIARYKVSWK